MAHVKRGFVPAEKKFTARRIDTDGTARNTVREMREDFAMDKFDDGAALREWERFHDSGMPPRSFRPIKKEISIQIEIESAEKMAANAGEAAQKWLLAGNPKQAEYSEQTSWHYAAKASVHKARLEILRAARSAGQLPSPQKEEMLEWIRGSVNQALDAIEKDAEGGK